MMLIDVIHSFEWNLYLQLLMYFLRMGIVSALLSETLVSGFTTGAAIGVFTSQIKDLLGVKLTPVIGKFEIPLVCNSCVYLFVFFF